MGVRYSNLFGWPFPHIPSQPVVSLPPIYSATTEYLPSGSGRGPDLHCKQFAFGDMSVGSSIPPAGGSVLANEPVLVQLPVSGPFGPIEIIAPGGLTVTVDAGNVPQGESLSKTLYLHFDNQAFLSSIGDSITAQLVFDLPNSTVGNGWSVAVNFKSGDQTDDHATDKFLGAMCHFTSDGYVKFNGIPNTVIDQTTSYAQLEENGTQFTLAVTLTVNGSASDSVASGTATLNYGNMTIPAGNAPGNVTPSGLGFPNFNEITAVGIAVVMVTTGNGTFGARLRSFSLAWTPPSVHCLPHR